MPQSLSNILLHLVFSTKNRDPLILPELESELYAYIAAIHKNIACPLLKIGGTDNHLHILCRMERVVTVSKLLEEVKKNSSKWIKGKDERLANFTWQAGYGAFSIGMSNVEALEKYIARQKTHHRKVSFQDEYRALLKKYRVEWDENYVWD
jgi:REP element-mobilizing transposase RayT